ncbi:SDR family NAD(P)-dependent oxidoreductase [Angustibacter sp. McL0619]|uniref:SDR family NAD(P)-dependent oxidoreductase n=1 Tax=Angustibacter sp. McL0619 TaxID=3415676 RepID=UPI003CF02180
MGTALVTGATAGIGHSFVRHLAADGYDLVLVARGQERLDEVAEEVRTVFGRKVETISADLTDRSDLQRVADRVGDPERPLDLLVNNAGFGLGHGFLRGDVAAQERLLDIHCRAVLVLSHAAAEVMAGRGQGAILNVSSVAGFAVMGTYSAVKAWETTFSEALAAELGPRGVRVMALCPGFVRTEFHERGRINMSKLPEAGWLDVDDVVSAGLADLARGRVVSIPSKRFKTVSFLSRHAPRSLVRKASSTIQARRASS